MVKCRECTGHCDVKDWSRDSKRVYKTADERYQAVELSFIKKKEVGRVIKQQVGLVKAR